MPDIYIVRNYEICFWIIWSLELTVLNKGQQGIYNGHNVTPFSPTPYRKTTLSCSLVGMYVHLCILPSLQKRSMSGHSVLYQHNDNEKIMPRICVATNQNIVLRSFVFFVIGSMQLILSSSRVQTSSSRVRKSTRLLLQMIPTKKSVGCQNWTFFPTWIYRSQHKCLFIPLIQTTFTSNLLEKEPLTYFMAKAILTSKMFYLHSLTQRLLMTCWSSCRWRKVHLKRLWQRISISTRKWTSHRIDRIYWWGRTGRD